MKLPAGFRLTRQDKPANCSAVALRNATEWIRHTAPVRVVGRMMNMTLADWETEMAYCDPGAKSHYIMTSWRIAEHLPLDVLHISNEVRDRGDIEPRLRSLLRAGWVLVAGIDSDYTQGGRHAVAIVRPAFTILDGKREAPYRWSFQDLAAHHIAFVMALRANRDLYPLVGER